MDHAKDPIGINLNQTIAKYLLLNKSFLLSIITGRTFSYIGLPSQPKIRALISSITNITVIWDIISYNGGYSLSAVTSYAECSTTSDTEITSTCNNCYKSSIKRFNTTQATISSLVERTHYQCRVAAINAVGVTYSSWTVIRTKG